MDLETRSKYNIKILACTLKYLIDTKNTEYDLIISVGNSGLATTELTRLVYKKLNRPFPKTLALPIYRYKLSKVRHSTGQADWFDNSVLLPKVIEIIESISNLKNVLVVDDEIGLGISIQAAIKLLNQALKESRQDFEPAITIIAEDHQFKFSRILSKKNTTLFSFGKHIPWTYHIITYHIPKEMIRAVKNVLTARKIGPRQVMNILLGLPIKTKNGTIPTFTFKYNDTAKKQISNFSALQHQYRSIIDSLISDGLTKSQDKYRTLNRYVVGNKIHTWKAFYK